MVCMHQEIDVQLFHIDVNETRGRRPFQTITMHPKHNTYLSQFLPQPAAVKREQKGKKMEKAQRI